MTQSKARAGVFRHAAQLLIGFRALLGLWLLLDAVDGQISRYFVWVFVIGVLSDVVDGELLRHQHLSDPKCRSLDSSTDAVFYMSVFVSMWFVHPAGVRLYMLPMTILLITQCCSWVFCLVRFGKITSYHSYLAKLWGLTLFIGTVNFFTVMQPAFVMLPIVVGIASHVEDIAITATIPAWRTDVIALWAARQQRNAPVDRRILLNEDARVMPYGKIGEKIGHGADCSNREHEDPPLILFG